MDTIIEERSRSVGGVEASRGNMGTPEKIYELVKALPENQAAEVLDFVEFLKQKARRQAGVFPPGAIPKGTLTGLKGIAKRSRTPPTDAELQEEYTDYLSHKYQ